MTVEWELLCVDPGHPAPLSWQGDFVAPSGLRLAFHQRPGDAGPPIVLLHGFGNEGRIWTDYLLHCPPSWPVIALDQRGHGDSDHPADADYRISSFAADVDALRIHLGLPQIVLVGHSLGGAVAARYAAGWPDRVAGLVLVDTGPVSQPDNLTEVRRRFAELSGGFADLDTYRDRLRSIYPLSPEETLTRIARCSARLDEAGGYRLKMDPGLVDALAALGTRDRNDDFVADLRAIACPARVVRGCASALLTQGDAAWMAAEVLRRGSLSVVDAAGHAVMIDNPAGFHQAVTGFIAETRRGATAGRPRKAS